MGERKPATRRLRSACAHIVELNGHHPDQIVLAGGIMVPQLDRERGTRRVDTKAAIFFAPALRPFGPARRVFVGGSSSTSSSDDESVTCARSSFCLSW